MAGTRQHQPRAAEHTPSFRLPASVLRFPRRSSSGRKGERRKAKGERRKAPNANTVRFLLLVTTIAMSKQPPDDHQDWHPPDSVRQRKPHHRAAFDPSLLPQPHPHPHPHHHDEDQDQSTPSRTSPLTEQHSPPQQNDQEAAAASKTKPKPKPRAKRFLAAAGLDHVPREIAWIPGVFTWPKLKPLIRSSIIAWICMLLMLIRPAERTLGSASFIVLIGAFIQPSELPLVAVLEREMFTLLFACAAWVWSIIAIAIAHAVRTNKIPASQANPTAIYNAQYLEARPAIVCAFFLSIGSAVLLYTKVRFGPGPFLFATIFSCILLNGQ